jgi:hypothetical protein
MMLILPEDNLTPEEEARFARLPRTAEVDRLGEERTVAALRERGLLGRSRRARARRALALVSATAAALLLFVSGVAFGQRMQDRQAPSGSPAAQVQAAGSAYVAAVVRLSESSPDSVPATVLAGLQAGTATLHAAATRLASIAPADSEVARLRAVLEFASASPNSDTNATNGHLVVWF